MAEEKPASGPEPRPIPWRALETAAVSLLFLLAAFLRSRDLLAPFDREFGGHQGAFFAIAAVNYERLGPGTSSGYPVLCIDPPGGSMERAHKRPHQWFTYANHPPTVPLLAWGGARLFGPEGWSETWRESRAPEGLEPALRIPFLLLHLAGLLALWWVARVAFGAQTALITIALIAVIPVSTYYGTLINYENPSLPFTLLAVGLYGRYVRQPSRWILAGLGTCFAIGSAVTFAPLFFLPPLVVRSALRRRWKEVVAVGAAGGTGALLPIVAHGFLAGGALGPVGPERLSIFGRARVLLEPLLDGTIPFADWLGIQLGRAPHAFGWAVCGAALGGLVLGLVRAVRRQWDARLAALEAPHPAAPPIDLASPLLFGGALYLFAFYRHTAEAQWPFLMFLAPGVALLAARALHQLSGPLLRLRGGLTPLVLCTASIALPSLAGFEGWRAAKRLPGTRDPGGHELGAPEPLPSTAGRAIAEVLPAGAVGLHPPVLGLNLAVNWYAWRSLLTAASPTDPAPALILPAVGLEEADNYLLLPDDPPPAAAAEVERLRASFPGGERGASGWVAHPLEKS